MEMSDFAKDRRSQDLVAVNQSISIIYPCEGQNVLRACSSILNLVYTANYTYPYTKLLMKAKFQNPFCMPLWLGMMILSFSPALLRGQNVGIGISAPAQKLHVNGNLRFDGALMPNGNAGLTGQVLISQGPGVAPVWSSIGNVINIYKATATRTLISSTAFTPITGLSQTINLTTNAVVMISTYGSLETTSSLNSGSGTIVQVFNNGVAIADMFQTTDVNDAAGFSNTIHHWSMMNTVNLTPGSYTFTVRARKYGFDNFYAGGNTTAPNPNEGNLILMVFAQ